MSTRVHDSAASRTLLFSTPAPIARQTADQIADRATDRLVDFVKERALVTGDGQSNGGSGNVEINERRAAISVLMSRLDKKALSKALATNRGRLAKTIRADIAWLEKAERGTDLGWAANGTSTPAVLKALAERRAHLAESAAQAIEKDPALAYDAGNDNISAHLALTDSKLRAQILADALLQFRAKKRSTALMDQVDGKERDGSMGRVASSGPLSALEQRLAVQHIPANDGREYALLRLAVANHPHASTNGIFQARNAVALLGHDRFLGRDIGEVYNAIHKNYSANTPKVVEQYFKEKVFTGGDISIYAALVEAASSDDPPARLARLKKTHGYSIDGTTPAKILDHLAKHTALPKLKKLRGDDLLFAHQTLLNLHASVATERPSDVTLEKNLFYAGEAWPEVAALIHALRERTHVEQVEAAGQARQSLRAAFEKTTSGFERQMLLRIDRQVELLSAELLGASVTHTEEMEDVDLSEWAVAVRSALRGALASGLDSIRAKDRTAKVPELSKMLEEVDALLAKGQASPEALRELSTSLFRSASEVAETMRGYFRRRELAIHFSDPRVDVELDPEFSDNLVKETSLHYLLALSQAGMMHGLEGEVSSTRITATQGMRVLSSIGPAVYERVLIAKNLDQLMRFEPNQNDFCVLSALDEKSMVTMGGLLTDTKEAPCGYSHLSVFAKGHGIAAIALPHLRTNYMEFFESVAGRGLYVDDRAGSFVMMPLEKALEAKLLKKEEIESLRPGFNKNIHYLDEQDGLEKEIASHQIHISSERPTREIELYVPDLTDRDRRGRSLTLEELGAMSFARTRHLAGEKGAVLARLRESKALKALGVKVPGGGSVPPYRIAQLLREAGIFDRWMRACAAQEFLTDREYRLKEAAALKKDVEKALGDLLVKRGKPTAAGRALLAELEASPDLKAFENWIARSSFTSEDRPNKSGAGQYESHPHLSTQAARLRGIAGVISSMWGATPIENNVQMQIDLSKVFPSVLVQRCLKPSVSGVAISRGAKGELGEVSYQVVPGFGGGVDKKKAEEGVLGKGQKESLLTPAQQTQLRDAVLAIEREFYETIEPGKGYAVDVEWAIENDELYIVQARVIVDGSE